MKLSPLIWAELQLLGAILASICAAQSAAVKHMEKMMGINNRRELSRLDSAIGRNRAGVIEAINPDMQRSTLYSWLVIGRGGGKDQ